MRLIAKPIRIEPAFEDREEIRAMLERYAPYRALASYAPEGIKEEAQEEAKRPVSPWFRGDWALAGKPLVEGAEQILHNRKFIEAAKASFGTSFVSPEFVVVNITGPMPACTTHVDNPSFYGATRVDYPLPLLRVMGSSGLFEQWRVVRASTLTWFYEGIGGNFDYWPEGLDGPMLSERPPFEQTSLFAQTRTACTTALVRLEMRTKNCPRCQPRHRSSRMAKATGPFWKMEKFAPLTQTMRFAFPYFGRPKFERERQVSTI